ncbi:hypothetical protein hmeg3_01635 [Herbaspirillum sp. meg3]|nr:hypothetical protein hmeg3_01635 [Herbaspirillum sp. meg3]
MLTRSVAKAIDSAGGDTVGRENTEMWNAFLSNWRDHNNAFWLCMSGNLDRISPHERKMRLSRAIVMPIWHRRLTDAKARKDGKEDLDHASLSRGLKNCFRPVDDVITFASSTRHA